MGQNLNINIAVTILQFKLRHFYMFLLGIQYQSFPINRVSALNSIYLFCGKILMKCSSGKIRQAPSTKSRHPRQRRPTAIGGADGRSDEAGRRKKRQRERKHGRRRWAERIASAEIIAVGVRLSDRLRRHSLQKCVIAL